MLKSIAIEFTTIALAVCAGVALFLAAVEVQYGVLADRNEIEEAKAFAAACQNEELLKRWLKGQD